MSDAVERATASQVKTIEAITGKTIEELLDVVAGWGPGKHNELLERAKETLGLTHGHANLVVHMARVRTEGATPEASPDPLDLIYAGSKAPLRPLHEALLGRLADLGPFDVAPKKANVSLRRSKQFATVGPGSRGRLELGVNLRGTGGTARFEELAPGGMCSHRAFVASVDEIDEELLAFVRAAYEASA